MNCLGVLLCVEKSHKKMKVDILIFLSYSKPYG
jgi:hypothetical protein